MGKKFCETGTTFCVRCPVQSQTPNIVQGAGNTVMAPAGVFARQPDD